jgi:hypothetical protein
MRFPNLLRSSVFQKAVMAFALMWAGLPNSLQAFEPVTTDHSFNTWWFANARYNVTDRWNITGLVLIRRADGLAEWQQYVLRPSVGLAINKQLEIGVGYTHARMYPYGDQPVAMQFTENNVFQQLVLRQKAGRVGLMHRARLEQRFIDHVERPSEGAPYIEGTDYANRFRLRIDGMIPVALNDRLFLAVYDEVFVHLMDEMLPDAFDQNRAYLGLGYQMNDKVRFELGLLHHFVRKRDGVRFESNPTMQMGVGFQLGPRKRRRADFAPPRAI